MSYRLAILLSLACGAGCAPEVRWIAPEVRWIYVLQDVNGVATMEFPDVHLTFVFEGESVDTTRMSGQISISGSGRETGNSRIGAFQYATLYDGKAMEMQVQNHSITFAERGSVVTCNASRIEMHPPRKILVEFAKNRAVKISETPLTP